MRNDTKGYEYIYRPFGCFIFPYLRDLTSPLGNYNSRITGTLSPVKFLKYFGSIVSAVSAIEAMVSAFSNSQIVIITRLFLWKADLRKGPNLINTFSPKLDGRGLPTLEV